MIAGAAFYLCKISWTDFVSRIALLLFVCSFLSFSACDKQATLEAAI